MNIFKRTRVTFGDDGTKTKEFFEHIEKFDPVLLELKKKTAENIAKKHLTF